MKSDPRPGIVTWLSAAVLIFSAVQFVGVFAWFSLPDLTFTVPRGYLLVKNLFWGITGLVAGVGLLTGRSWAFPLSRWGTLLFGIFMLIDLIWLRSSNYALQARTFNIMMTLGGVMLVIGILNRPRIRSFFRR